MTVDLMDKPRAVEFERFEPAQCDDATKGVTLSFVGNNERRIYVHVRMSIVESATCLSVTLECGGTLPSIEVDVEPENHVIPKLQLVGQEKRAALVSFCNVDVEIVMAHFGLHIIAYKNDGNGRRIIDVDAHSYEELTTL